MPQWLHAAKAVESRAVVRAAALRLTALNEHHQLVLSREFVPELEVDLMIFQFWFDQVIAIHVQLKMQRRVHNAEQRQEHLGVHEGLRPAADCRR
jgi:hypothetical protein